MNKSQVMKICFFFAVAFGATFNAWGKEIGLRSESANYMLNKLQMEHETNIVYINAMNLTEISVSTLSQIRDEVIMEGKRYFIDFSAIKDDKEKKMAKQLLSNVLVVKFPSDWIVIGSYKGELIYTPLSNKDDPMFQIAMNRKNNPGNRALRSTSSSNVKPRENGTTGIPHIAFYLEVNKKITNEDCTFANSPVFTHGNRIFCDDANIALIYRINLMRSLKHSASASTTPDAKLVRISLDQDSTGAGIQLNEKLDWTNSISGESIFDGWIQTFATDAIAKDYKFEISASNDKAAILKTYPTSNLNANYENRDTSGFEMGITGGGEVDGVTGPKAKLEANFKYNQSRTLVYNTQDYAVVRSAPSAQKVSFTWEREQYKDAASLLKFTSGTIFDKSYPVDHARIRSIGYKGFTPNFDIIYKAKATETGDTTFNIASSVNLYPIYTGIYRHYYVIGSHHSFQGKKEWEKSKRITALTTFGVNWTNAVFTGGRPVNLQLGGVNNKCLQFGFNDKETGKFKWFLGAEDCDKKNLLQSFIYDQDGRYASVLNTNHCLEGSNLTTLVTCNGNLSQRWKWKADSDNLQNEYQNKFLAHDINSNRLSLVDGPSGVLSTRMLTRYTGIYSTDYGEESKEP